MYVAPVVWKSNCAIVTDIVDAKLFMKLTNTVTMINAPGMSFGATNCALSNELWNCNPIDIPLTIIIPILNPKLEFLPRSKNSPVPMGLNTPDKIIVNLTFFITLRNNELQHDVTVTVINNGRRSIPDCKLLASKIT